jgi:tRNA A-37 threonylcarbamoyl transferase component Bud32
MGERNAAKPGGAADVSAAGPADAMVTSDSTLDHTRVGPAPPDDLRRRWQHGDRLRVETYFEQNPALAQDEEAAIDLIYCEFLLRAEGGEAPRPEEYVARFPRYAQRLQFLLAFDEAVCDLIRSPSLAQRSTEAAAPAEVTVEKPPERIGGKYKVIELLDRGGQGEVYRALHETLRRDVVIKLSRRPCPQESHAREAFLAEGRILAGLQHPNIASVFDLDFYEDRAYLAIEFVRGLTLDQFARSRRPAPREAAALLVPVARALAEAHRRGVVHRDLKPRNILIDEQGRPRVIDFGLARLHDAWSNGPPEDDRLSGTLPFMPPEQAHQPAEPADARSDIFALGAVLYFLLTGKPLYSGGGTSELIDRARRCDYDQKALRDPAIPEALRATCLKALAPDLQRRHSTADELGDELEALLQPRPRKRWVGWAVAITLGVALLAFISWQWLGRPGQDGDRANGNPEPTTLSVEVREPWPGQKPRNLLNVPSPRTGDQIKVIARVPRGVSASLLHVDRRGKWTKLASRPAEATAPLIAPAAEGVPLTLTEPSGTELLLIIGRKDGPSPDLLDALAALGQVPVTFPDLPKDAYLRMLPGRVIWEPIQRAIEQGAQPAPEWAAADRLERIRQALEGHFDYMEGIAFTHK